MDTNVTAIIKGVDPGGIGAELGLEPGDAVLRINGIVPQDYIDFLLLSSEEELNIEILKKDGELFELEIEKEPEESLGIFFESAVFDGIRNCSNHCLFCFVHQLPSGQRSTLYIRDDDYRLSFLQGAYVTLTNLTEADWKRIERLRLSPVYVSVHATDPAVRQRLLGSKAGGKILEQLERLANAGICVHTQAVLCPGINEGLILEKTITDLAALWPSVASLAIVPVGLTTHRENLFSLNPYQKQQARRVLSIIAEFQQKLAKSLGTRFVFAADEWYIIAEEPIPADEEYEDYPQLDNGVGLIRRFLRDFYRFFTEKKEELEKGKANLTIITGKSTAKLWPEVINAFKTGAPEIKLAVLPVENKFFGKTVTVTGLLSGSDIAAAILNHQSQSSTVYLIPEITLKQGENLFLDNISLAELKEKCRPKRIEVVPTAACDWIDWIINEGSVKS